MQDMTAEIAALKKENHLLKSQLQQLEARLALLSQKTFQKTSEKHPGQLEPDFEINEAEFIVDQSDAVETQTIAEHSRQKRAPKSKTLIPEHLPRVEVKHECQQRDCACCQQPMTPITPVVQEQLACLPSRYYVVKHVF